MPVNFPRTQTRPFRQIPGASSTAAGSLVVIDTLTNAIVRTLTFAEGARAVTVSRAGQRVFVCRDGATVTIVRATDFAVIGEIPVGIQPSDLTPRDSYRGAADVRDRARSTCRYP